MYSNRLRLTAVTPLVLVLLFAATAVPAQEEQGAEEELDPLFSMSFEELLQVKVTGPTLTELDLRHVPSAVTVFTRRELDQLGVDSLQDLMNFAPGFQSYRSSNSSVQSVTSSRGRRIATFSAEILVLVDGQRIDEPRSSGSAVVTPGFPLTHIERVEFIRGPGSAIYGSNAMMGVVNIVTRSDVNEVGVGYGSFNRRKGHLLASHRIGDVAIDLFAQIEADDGDDYRVQDTFSPSRIDTKDPQELLDLNVKLRWQNTRVNLQHSQIEYDDFYSLATLSNGFNSGYAQLSSISLKQDFDWGPVASWARLSYSKAGLELSTQLTPPGALAPISSPASNDPLLVGLDSPSNEARLQWHNDWDINPQSSLQAGVELRQIDVASGVVKGNFDLGALANRRFPIASSGTLDISTTTQAESEREIVGLYSQYQRQLSEKLRLTLGLRFDDFSGIGSRFSPRFGLVRELSDHHSLKLLYGEAFRAPSENELSLQNNPVTLGNPGLRPEIVESRELIWVGQWSRTSASAGYFENRFKDSIVQSNVGGGVLQVQNADQGPGKGFELELFQELNDRLRLRASYTAIIENSDPSFREADRLASLMVNYQRGNLNANLSGSYAGARETPVGGSDVNRITLDDYWMLFGKLSYDFNRDWQTYVQVKNLLDEEYQTPAANSALIEGIPNRGREILGGIVRRF